MPIRVIFPSAIPGLVPAVSIVDRVRATGFLIFSRRQTRHSSDSSSPQNGVTVVDVPAAISVLVTFEA